MKYTMPEIEFVELGLVDVITTSSGGDEGPTQGENETPSTPFNIPTI